jgi:hypothetical protein
MTVFSTPERVVIRRVLSVTSWSMSRSTVTIVVSTGTLSASRVSLPITSSASKPCSSYTGMRRALTTSRTFGNCAARSSGMRVRVALYSAYCSCRKVGPDRSNATAT